jgi:hypothetical protein
MKIYDWLKVKISCYYVSVSETVRTVGDGYMLYMCMW